MTAISVLPDERSAVQSMVPQRPAFTSVDATWRPLSKARPGAVECEVSRFDAIDRRAQEPIAEWLRVARCVASDDPRLE